MSRAVDDALAALLITSIHHAYGAWAFDTPWRLQMLMIALPAAAVIFVASATVKREGDTTAGSVAFWTLAIVTIAVPVALVGMFEGTFNHVVKIVVYYGGGSPLLYSRLFPFPAHELPRDLFFEVTGVLQAIPAFLAGGRLAPVLAQRLRRELRMESEGG